MPESRASTERNEMNYEITEIPEATYAVIRRTVAFEDVAKAMPELMEKVQGWTNTTPHGVHMCISSMAGAGDPDPLADRLKIRVRRSSIEAVDSRLNEP
jgi:predicted transcriptional regulator YdeE